MQTFQNLAIMNESRHIIYNTCVRFDKTLLKFARVLVKVHGFRENLLAGRLPSKECKP